MGIIIARDASDIPRFLRTDSDGNLNVSLTDGTEDVSVTSEGYLDVAAHSNENGKSIAFGVSAVDATTGYVLIDLSDATHYPHTDTGKIDVDWIMLHGLGDNATVGVVEIGFIKSITADNADWYSIFRAAIDKQEQRFAIMLAFHPQHIHCDTTNHLSGGDCFNNDDATFQNDTALTATYSTATPAVGDLVLKITLSAGTVISLSVVVGYHTHST